MGYAGEMPFTQVKAIVASLMSSRLEENVVLVSVVVVALVLFLLCLWRTDCQW